MANCTNCGATLTSDQQFCSACGAQVSAAPPAAAPPPPQYAQGQYQPPPQAPYQPPVTPPQAPYQPPQPPPYQAPQGQYQPPPQNTYAPPPGQYQPPYYQQQPLTPEQDIASNKGMAVLGYFGPFMLIPLLSAKSKNSPYVRYHCNQGLIMLILAIAWGIVQGIIRGILNNLLWYSLVGGGGYGFYVAISWVLTLVSIGISVLDIIGIVNAATGKMKPVPLVGRFTILK